MKEDLRYISINKLSELTGICEATIKKRLKDLEPVKTQGPARLYESKHALKLIYYEGKQHEQKLDLQSERAKLAKVQTEKTTLEVEKLKGNLIPITDVCAEIENEYTYVRTKILAIPTKAAGKLALVDSPKEIKKELDKAISEVLSELVADVKYKNGATTNHDTRELTESNTEDESEDFDAASESQPS